MYLLILLGIFLLWRLQSYVFRKYWDRNLSVRLEFADSHIYEGDRSVLREILVNDKRFPVPAVHVRLIIPRELTFADEVRENTVTSDQTYKRDIFSFIGRQQITRQLGFTGTRRGYYELNTLDIAGSDFFFREGNYKSLPQNASLYVFPKQISSSRIKLICREITGSVMVQNRLHPDPFAFSGIRDYEKSDPMNHVNWKASARMGSLMVNQYDSTTNMNVTVILDVEDRHILSKNRLVEEGIRITSSLAGRMGKQKMPLRVCSNALVGTEGQRPLDRFLPAAGGNIMELNQELACIDSSRLLCGGEELLQKVLEEKTSGHIYLLLTGNTSEAMQQKAVWLAGADNQVIWVVPYYEDEEPVMLQVKGVQSMGWEVTRWQ